MHFYRCTDFADPAVYADARAFFTDLAKVYREEIVELAAAGCRYIQLDEVALAMLCDPAAREKVKAGGQDPERLVDLYVDAINEAPIAHHVNDPSARKKSFELVVSAFFFL